MANRQSTRTSVPDGIKHKAADMLANPEIKTKLEVAEACGINESTLYGWLKKESFIKLVNKKLDKYTDKALPEVWDALIEKAKGGDTQAIKLYFEMKNKYKDRKEISHEGIEGLGNHLKNLSDDELDQMEKLARKATGS